jgi:hypothetical protein
MTKRIGGLSPRLAALEARTGELIARQRGFLRKLAVGELQAQQARLTTYRVQARFALAALYDRASAANAPQTGQPAQARERR